MAEKRVTRFEIPCEQPEKTMRFFENVFDWTFQQLENQEYWFAITGKDAPGIDGAIMKKRDPNQPITNSISVGDLDQTITQIENFGGQVVVEKMAIPASGWLCFFKDPEGNIHGVWQDDPDAR